MLAAQRRNAPRRVFREDVKEYLIQAILVGRLRPGERIVETQVAQELGISQGPVREALRDLDIFGFVTCEPFRGARVRQLSHADLVSIYPVRAALEGVAAHAAARRTDAAFAERLTILFAQLRRVATGDDRAAFMAADNALHAAIVEHSGNDWLHRFWGSMNFPMTTVISVSLSNRSLPELAERHAVLVAALIAGDAAVAELAMRQHIAEIGDWVLASLDAHRPQTAGAAPETTMDASPQMHT